MALFWPSDMSNTSENVLEYFKVLEKWMRKKQQMKRQSQLTLSMGISIVCFTTSYHLRPEKYYIECVEEKKR